ncbi:MAG: molybdate ABC transporter permease subunit [Acidimicrobiia bacterium]|nr:molybdate ABC transporter permease subunit [Acidimicrobiia bacterium]MYC57412.1 molybdate ABC transporter permease subunit [Acidimicrobiia bacterium]MYG94609.1 molybdate ABC transporter permease subunit [Acidimicrobiia bacterium]MYI30250.1 molybdate ABC transporter permease subunit [Acidimicrobiia bacterium]
MSDRPAPKEPARQPPIIIVVIAAIAVAVLALPLIGLLQRTPWPSLGSTLGKASTLEALRVSVVVSILAATVSVVLGLPLAWVLARLSFRGRALVRAVVLLPMVLPPVVGGIALFFALGRRGLVGRALQNAFGVDTLIGTTAGAVIAAAFVSMPFFVITAEAGLRQLDPRLESAAATLGAGRWTVLRRITLPLLAPSLAAGATLSWARALGEFGATITFAGNHPGRTRTLPLAIAQANESAEPEAAIVMAVLLIGVSLVVLIGLRHRWITPYAHKPANSPQTSPS